MFFFLFFSSDICFFAFLGYLGLKRPHILGEKQQQQQQQQQQQNIRIRLGKGTLNTCAKIQGLTLKNGVRTFVWLGAKITAWHCNYVVLVYTPEYSILDLKFDLVLVLRSQLFDFLPETLYNMPWSTWKRLVQKWVIFFFPTVNAHLLLTSLKVCDWSGHIFV